MTAWQVSVFSTTTDELLADLPARSPDRNEVRAEWGIPPRTPIMELLVTDEHLAFVNALLDEPLELKEGQEAYLSEYAEYPGEEVID